VDEQQLLALKPELDRFLDRFALLFGRDENPTHARRLVQGLLHGGERRNTENIAQAMSGGPVRSLQAFLSTGAWPDSAILKKMRCGVLEVLADDDAVWNSDETGFPKKGTRSVGVKRQYSGTWAGPTTARSPSSPTTPRRRGTPSWAAGCSFRRTGPATVTAVTRPGSLRA
jgi:SRSO17 transposase